MEIRRALSTPQQTSLAASNHIVDHVQEARIIHNVNGGRSKEVTVVVVGAVVVVELWMKLEVLVVVSFSA